MQNNNQALQRRRILNILLLIGFMAFTAFGPGNLPVVQAQESSSPKASSWIEFIDPYWAFHILYPSDWQIQNIPYKDFGWRISSPNLTTDPLGRPTLGGYFGVSAFPSAEQVASPLDDESYGATDVAKSQVVISGIQTIRTQGTMIDGNLFENLFFQSNGWTYQIKIVAEKTSAKTVFQVSNKIIENFAIGQTPTSYPYNNSVNLRTLSVSFPAIKHAFLPGSGKIITGYGPSGDHIGGDLYAFDIIECNGSVGGQCNQGVAGQSVMAPTDMTLIYSGPGTNMPSSSKDFNIFEVASDSTQRLCMSLAHVMIFSQYQSGRIPRGTLMGILVSYPPSFPHIHMGLWTTPISVGCGSTSSRTAVAYTGQFQLDGVDYAPASGYAGRSITSTNYAVCSSAAANLARSSSCGSDNASFVADISIPDGTSMNGGQSFTKTWRIQNTGTTTWGSGYNLAFTGGDQMGAPSSISVPSTSPGNTVDLSINMTSPSSSGDYTGTWRMQNPQGQKFGDPIWVTINVVGTPPPPPGNMHVEYFNDTNLGSRCFDGYENNIYVFKRWDNGSPANGCNSDNFSARFTETLNFQGGDYSFHCQHDDGCRIYIDGVMKGDWWWASDFTGHDWGGTLPSGNHEVKVEFYDSGGNARVEAFWSGPGFLPTGPSCDSSQWCASYYGNQDLSGTPAINRAEGTGSIMYDWGGGGIGYGFPNDNFSVRWQRNVNFAAGKYRFHIRVDDGGRLYVNNTNVIDHWVNEGTTEYTADVDLSNGTIPISFEYFENGGGAVAQLWWDTLQLNNPPYNLLMNSDFEDGSTVPGWWSQDAWVMSNTTFEWATDYAHSGSKSIKVISNIANDARWTQIVNVQPNSVYKLSGWIKTDNVSHSGQAGDNGANLSTMGDVLTNSTGLFGTNDWTNVSYTFNTGTANQITVGARVGTYSGTTTGTAWFDNLDLELLSAPICHSLTVSVLPSSNGNVIASPSPNCNNGTQYIHGTVVQLNAFPILGSVFSSWSNDASGSSNPTFISMTSDKLATANFTTGSTKTFQSVGANDGWVLESSENSNVGGSINSTANLGVGDNGLNRQLRSILSFNTGATLPDTAVITKATLKVMKSSLVGGGNPVSLLQGFMVDIKKGFFGALAGLETSDFQAAAGKSFGPFSPAVASNWYTINLPATAYPYINKVATASGLTQVRIRFKLDDNNNLTANYLGLYSGNAVAAYRPQLIIQYYVP